MLTSILEPPMRRVEVICLAFDVTVRAIKERMHSERNAMIA
jgi:hypothetical protein